MKDYVEEVCMLGKPENCSNTLLVSVMYHCGVFVLGGGYMKDYLVGGSGGGGYTLGKPDNCSNNL